VSGILNPYSWRKPGSRATIAGAAGTSESSNVADAEPIGWEAEADYDSDRVFTHLSYASIDGPDLSDGSDLGSPTPDRLALNAGVKVPEWNARLGTRIQHAAEFAQRVADGAGGLMIADQRDSYTIVDIYMTWRPDFANAVRFDISVDNVFDENDERVFAGVSEPARNVKVAASWQFGG
jgi:hemoglobin/transferrin/lactoferrin receptor protein